MIDWAAYTPYSALTGGALIGLAVALFVLFDGRIAGICPGPGLVLLGLGDWRGALFIAAMLVGMTLFELFERHSAQIKG